MKSYYEEEGCTIYHGDCREVMPGLLSESIDLVVTDPPYGHNNNDGDLIHHREAALGLVKNGRAPGVARPIANDGPEANELVRWLFQDTKRLLKPGCCCCCCGGGGGPDPQFARWALWMDQPLSFKQMVVWDKGGLGMGWHYRRNYEVILIANKPGAAVPWYGGNSIPNVIRLSGIKPGPEDHPTPKPQPLFDRFISWHSLPGETVLDPFMGHGTTVRAAKDLGRKAIGIEVSERYCEIAAKRLAQGVLDFTDDRHQRRAVPMNPAPQRP